MYLGLSYLSRIILWEIIIVGEYQIHTINKIHQACIVFDLILLLIFFFDELNVKKKKRDLAQLKRKVFPVTEPYEKGLKLQKKTIHKLYKKRHNTTFLLT